MQYLMQWTKPIVAFGVGLLFAGASWGQTTQAIAKPKDTEWLSYGRDYREQRYSPLDQVNPGNVQDLGLAWFMDTDSNRGLEATPLIAEGIMYVSGSWSVVYAIDAGTGQRLWSYDPQVDKAYGKRTCCDVVNRGVSLYEDKVFVGTLDGRLVALNKTTGQPIWSVSTLQGEQGNYSITGAPRAANGLVYIGNGGAEYGVRGFVSAYSASSGELVWRFYTVPGDPDHGFENEAMVQAATTWTGEWWSQGGGGTVWDSIVYDEEFDQILIGVGNGSPWNRRVRSPDGGDNLYLSSVVALDAKTGEYRWHFQETPGDSWDYTATQHIMLADMTIDGRTRKVLWHAPKNGFFFIIDRASGDLISAEPYVKVTWAIGYDPITKRPFETENADYSQGPQLQWPSPMGGHNWQPMAHSPDTGLVYIPIHEMAYQYADESDYKVNPGHWNTAVETDQGGFNNALLMARLQARAGQGYLQAWDPATQSERWRIPLPTIWNGGVLATAGGLVVQGNSAAELAVYDAQSGAKLWAYATQERIVAPPVSYQLDGEQYIAVAVSWGGAVALAGGMPPGPKPERARILAFKLGGDAELPALPEPVALTEPPKPWTDAPEIIEHGRMLYMDFCLPCHGNGAVGNGSVPDLRHLPNGFYAAWDAVVLDGALVRAGMVGFSDVLTPDDSAAIKAYVLTRAQQDWQLSQQPPWWVSFKTWWYDKVAIVLLWLAELAS
ncbi:MAG: PQQ-dependent dehydrogenase, methanol/ethanol family [Halieaceae bacterium]|nr:PQQ-dependent dehydrogenase, methanol/ethanol family [Halieaceae bacterium]